MHATLGIILLKCMYYQPVAPGPESVVVPTNASTIATGDWGESSGDTRDVWAQKFVLPLSKIFYGLKIQPLHSSNYDAICQYGIHEKQNRFRNEFWLGGQAVEVVGDFHW